MEVIPEDPDEMSMFKVRLIEGGKYPDKKNPRLIHPVQRAVKGESGVDIEWYPNYRGVMVIGVWSWLDTYGY